MPPHDRPRRQSPAAGKYARPRSPPPPSSPPPGQGLVACLGVIITGRSFHAASPHPALRASLPPPPLSPPPPPPPALPLAGPPAHRHGRRVSRTTVSPAERRRHGGAASPGGATSPGGCRPARPSRGCHRPWPVRAPAAAASAARGPWWRAVDVPRRVGPPPATPCPRRSWIPLTRLSSSSPPPPPPVRPSKFASPPLFVHAHCPWLRASFLWRPSSRLLPRL